tara:strand:- start:53 stop:157 length:105 start_codon:yes stop_codon:yes gene_type:complete
MKQNYKSKKEMGITYVTIGAIDVTLGYSEDRRYP